MLDAPTLVVILCPRIEAGSGSRNAALLIERFLSPAHSLSKLRPFQCLQTFARFEGVDLCGPVRAC
jgi:hypothetical protein